MTAVGIYHLRDPRDPRFASAALRGTWKRGGGLCPECGAGTSELIPPLIIEWETGSGVIGDFVWPGFDNLVVVSDRVRRAFQDRFPCTFHDVEMWQDPKLKRPSRETGRTKRRVWLPYGGPPLWWLVPIGRAELDQNASNWVFEKKCSTCGRSYWDIPKEGRRTVLDRTSWTSHQIFGIQDVGWIFCTEEVKRFVENEAFTDVSFEEDGWIPD